MKRRTTMMLLAGVMTAALAVPALADNLEDSKAKFEEAVATLKTTDNHDLLAEGLIFEVPDAVGTAEGFIPCITQGGPGSLYEGTYKGLWDAIDKYNCEKFGHKQAYIDAARLPISIMF